MGRTVSRALGVNRGGTVSRAFGGNQNLAAAIGVVAAIALPFAVPVIAGAIGTSLAVSPLVASTMAGGLYGAATGALSGSLVGDVGRGAAIGGAGGAVGGFIQGGGIEAARGALFGPSTNVASPALNAEVAANTMAAPAEYGGAESFGSAAGYQGAATPAYGAAEAVTPGVAISPGGTEGVTAGGIGSAAAPTGGAGGAAAPTGTRVERFFGGLTGGGTKMDLTTAEGIGRSLSGLASPAGLASVGQLAMTMYNKPPEGLTAQERAFVDETASLAGTNRELFDSRVREARRLLQQGTPNPEQAFGQANLALQRRIREAGLRSPEDVRRALIEGTRIGAASIPAEYARAAGATQAGLSAMPTTAPAGAASLALPAYRDAERRQREYEAGLARGIGGLAGALGGNRKGLFA